MRKELLVAVIASLALLAYYHSASGAKADVFEDWKTQYGANWAPEEEVYRRLIFEKNLQNIERHNADHSQTYKMGVNQFTVLTTEEFVESYLGAKPMEESVDVSEVEVSDALNGDVDWTTKGGVSPVKNQGSCGSCWAFSATGVLESWNMIKGQTYDLSEQQLVDCSRPLGNQGCNGGWPAKALDYIKTNGITSEKAYPYVARDQTCKTAGGSVRLSDYSSYPGSSFANTISAAPISVTVDATNWSSYRSGVFNNCRSSINHAVLLVGVLGGNWKIKNSWGTTWGEVGYIRLAPGNTCGLQNNVGVVPK
jgi:cathepsin L